MKGNCLSIITNFGCHYTCGYCIVKENNLRVPRTTINGLENLRQAIIDNNINMVSLSGGGDPCYKYENNKEWYLEFFKIMSEFNIPIELHTSYGNYKYFPYNKFDKVVYHFIDTNDILKINNYDNKTIRVVFVVTEDFTELKVNNIVDLVGKEKELSFRQMVDSNYKTMNYLNDYLAKGHKKNWWYITQDDYNLYYSENKLSYKYEDFKNKA